MLMKTSWMAPINLNDSNNHKLLTFIPFWFDSIIFFLVCSLFFDFYIFCISGLDFLVWFVLRSIYLKARVALGWLVALNLPLIMFNNHYLSLWPQYIHSKNVNNSKCLNKTKNLDVEEKQFCLTAPKSIRTQKSCERKISAFFHWKILPTSNEKFERIYSLM